MEDKFLGGIKVDTRMLWNQFSKDEFLLKFYGACNHSGKNLVEKLDSDIEDALYQTVIDGSLNYPFYEKICISFLMSTEYFKTWKALTKKYNEYFSSMKTNSMLKMLDELKEKGVYIYVRDDDSFVTVDITKIKR